MYNGITKRKGEEEKMFWVMRSKDDKTVAMTCDKEVANWIAKNFPDTCDIRETDSQGYVKKVEATS